VPGLGDALELVLASVLEFDPRTGDEVLDGARNEHFAGLGHRCDPGADVDGDAAGLAVDQLALAAVQPRTNVEVELADPLLDREAQWIARAGPSKVAKKPSPAVSISLPRKRPGCERTVS